jgi:Protein of unknown function (DUF3179)
MKSLFYVGVVGLIIFEILNVYFIMPMPGSQRIRSIDIAYFLYTYRWLFRIALGLLVILGIQKAYSFKKWAVVVALILLCAAIYAFNFQMAADSMFYQPANLQLVTAKQNTIKPDRLVLGVAINGQAKAYPIALIGYHHQVRDTLGGKPIMVTYCTVCRTGRVFEPLVDGKPEKFRLVGMDYFNAMFEDETTKSWWRQANGEAITGKLKGKFLPELPAQQTSLATWLKLYPNSKIMQPDNEFKDNYDSTGKYEFGQSKKELTGTDPQSWKRKSWVLGIQINQESIAIDWNRIVKERILNLSLGGKNIIVVLAKDNKSFFAFEKKTNTVFEVKNDTLYTADNQKFNLKGENTDSNLTLTKINVYQEFWHSWQTFHPSTKRY